MFRKINQRAIINFLASSKHKVLSSYLSETAHPLFSQYHSSALHKNVASSRKFYKPSLFKEHTLMNDPQKNEKALSLSHLEIAQTIGLKENDIHSLSVKGKLIEINFQAFRNTSSSKHLQDICETEKILSQNNIEGFIFYYNPRAPQPNNDVSERLRMRIFDLQKFLDFVVESQKNSNRFKPI